MNGSFLMSEIIVIENISVVEYKVDLESSVLRRMVNFDVVFGDEKNQERIKGSFKISDYDDFNDIIERAKIRGRIAYDVYLSEKNRKFVMPLKTVAEQLKDFKTKI